MKTKQVCVIAVLLLGCVGQAMAMYDPQTGRFLSRDPRGEPGFEVMQRASGTFIPGAGRMLERRNVRTQIARPNSGRALQRTRTRLSNENSNPYLFVRNNAPNRIDYLGLFELDSRTEANLAKLFEDFRPEARDHIRGANELLLPKCKCAKIIQSLRTIAEQNAIPGANTRVRGANSYHVWGLAYDIGIFKLPVGETDCENATQYLPDDLDSYKLAAEPLVDNEVVEWGGNWTTFQDWPHYQYPVQNFWPHLDYGNLGELVADYEEYIAMPDVADSEPPEFLLMLLYD